MTSGSIGYRELGVAAGMNAWRQLFMDQDMRKFGFEMDSSRSVTVGDDAANEVAVGLFELYSGIRGCMETVSRGCSAWRF